MRIRELIESTSPLDETIRKVEGGFRLYSKKGKNLGTYPTRAGAEKREKQVNYFKHVNETENSATADLADSLEKTKATSYNAIDSLMQRIAKENNITAKELHDRWIKKYGVTPDDWIKEKLNEGPIWDKVKKTAAAGAVAGAAGYGALTGQFADKAKDPARAPLEITIPGGDIGQQKPEAKSDIEKLSPSTASKIVNPDMEKIAFVTAWRSGLRGEELAQFMGQIAHETLGFKHMSEVGNTDYFKRYDPEHNPKKAKILGNVNPGDGEKYKGRGFIQITGRENYRKAGKALNLPLEEKPGLAAKPEVAAKIAVWFWKNRVKPKVNDYTDTISVT
ncbi:MAG: glycoside hydrolase family 19 protein, partial [Phycisphaerales bacterium]